MLGVAINENVFVSKAELSSDKKRLEITFEELTTKKPNFFEMSNSSTKQEVTTGSITVNMFRFNVPTYKVKKENDRELTNEEKINSINRDINERKNIMIHILERFIVPADSIKFNMYEGLDVTVDNWEQAWLDDSILAGMFTNMSNQFIEQLQPYIGNKELLSRLKLVRQSKEKHYPTFPKGAYLDDQPFFEPMEVPKEQSKVKFSTYEINNGLNSSEVPTRGTDADPVEEATPEVKKSIFGAR